MRVSLAGSVFYPSVSQVMELPCQIVCAWRSEEFRDLLLIQQQICLYNTIYNQNKFVLHIFTVGVSAGDVEPSVTTCVQPPVHFSMVIKGEGGTSVTVGAVLVG